MKISSLILVITIRRLALVLGTLMPLGALVLVPLLDSQSGGGLPHPGVLLTSPNATACSVGASGAIYTTVEAAVNDTSCDPINVQAGTYSEHILINRSLTLNGAGANSTFIDGGGTGRVISVTNGVSVTIASVTIRNGLADATNGEDGAGIYSKADALTVMNSTISANHATRDGGGILNLGFLRLAGSQVMSNTAGEWGGGLFNADTATMEQSKVSGNRAEAVGGGIVNDIGTSLEVSASQIANNSSGIQSGGIHNTGALTITNSTISLNQSQTGGGGISSDDWLSLRDSQVTTNTVTGAGGGLWNAEIGTAMVDNTLFSGNVVTGSQGSGGGVFNQGQPGITILNSRFTANRANYGAGFAGDVTSTATVSNSIFTGNVAGIDGGGVAITETAQLLLVNSTFTGNSAGRFAGAFASLGVLTATGNLAVDNPAGETIGGAIGIGGGTATLIGNTVYVSREFGLRIDSGPYDSAVNVVAYRNVISATGDVSSAAAGVVFSGTLNINATLGGAPANANTFWNSGGNSRNVVTAIDSSNPNIDARYNFWSLPTLGAVDQSIDDQADNPDVALVVYNPACGILDNSLDNHVTIRDAQKVAAELGTSIPGDNTDVNCSGAVDADDLSRVARGWHSVP